MVGTGKRGVVGTREWWVSKRRGKRKEREEGNGRRRSNMQGRCRMMSEGRMEPEQRILGNPHTALYTTHS
jgi:hypothetical protein